MKKMIFVLAFMASNAFAQTMLEDWQKAVNEACAVWKVASKTTSVTETINNEVTTSNK